MHNGQTVNNNVENVVNFTVKMEKCPRDKVSEFLVSSYYACVCPRWSEFRLVLVVLKLDTCGII